MKFCSSLGRQGDPDRGQRCQIRWETALECDGGRICVTGGRCTFWVVTRDFLLVFDSAGEACFSQVHARMCCGKDNGRRSPSSWTLLYHHSCVTAAALEWLVWGAGTLQEELACWLEGGLALCCAGCSQPWLWVRSGICTSGTALQQLSQPRQAELTQV